MAERRGAALPAIVLAFLPCGAVAQPLTPEELDVVRHAARRVGTAGLSAEGPPALVRAAEDLGRDVSLASRERVARALLRDGELVRDVMALLDLEEGSERWVVDGVELSRRRVSGGADAGTGRALPPDAGELRTLSELAADLRRLFAVPDPGRPLPYRLDAGAARARAWPRRELLWGVVSSRLPDRRAVAEAVLLDVGDAPCLVEALAVLHGECGGRAACWTPHVAHALGTGAAIGLAPVADALAAGAVSDPGDPAFATAILVVDEIAARASPSVAAALLRSAPLRATPPHRARAIAEALGRSPARLDRDLARRVREFAAGAPP